MDASGSFIIQDVKIFTGDDFIANGFVHVEDGRVVDVGAGKCKSERAQQPPSITRPGDTLIPGLIDAHLHALGGNVHSIEQSLRFGVTTVCDMHNDPRDNQKLKKLCDNPSNRSKYSDFKFAGLGAIVEGGWPVPVLKKEFENAPNGEAIAEKIISSLPKLKSPAGADEFVKQQIQHGGSSYIKMFHELGDSIGMQLPEPPMNVQKAVAKAAHDNVVIAVGHAFSYKGAMSLLNAGVDGLTHIFFDQGPLDEFVAAMKANNAHCSPTLALCASQTGEGGEFQRRFTECSFPQRMLLNKVPGKPVGFAVSERPRSSVKNAYETVKALYRNGVPLLVGTDAAGKDLGTPYGLGVHMEMYLLAHEIGMSPLDVLRSATSVTADRFGFSDRGRITRGRKADLVLVQGDIEDMLTDANSLCLPISAVWRDGIPASAFEPS